MTDFINYPTRNYAKPKKMIMTEATAKIIEEEVGDIENLTEQEVVTKINESKKAVAKKTKKGVRVKQSLNG